MHDDELEYQVGQEERTERQQAFFYRKYNLIQFRAYICTFVAATRLFTLSISNRSGWLVSFTASLVGHTGQQRCAV